MVILQKQRLITAAALQQAAMTAILVMLTTQGQTRTLGSCHSLRAFSSSG